MMDTKSAYRVLMGGSEGNRPLGAPWRRWDNNIKTDLQDVGWECDLAQDREHWWAVVNAEMNF
jgi:hypothetical protein